MAGCQREAATAAEAESGPAAGETAMGRPRQGADWAIPALVAVSRELLQLQGWVRRPGWALARAFCAALVTAPSMAPRRRGALHMQRSVSFHMG